MKSLVAVVAAVLVMAVGGCAILSPAPSAPWAHWRCDSRAEFDWRFVDAEKTTVQLKLAGAEQVYRLAAEPGSDGRSYSDGVLAFALQGDGGLVYWVATNDLIGRGCKAP